MKIMHLLNTGSFSGAENVVCQIIDLMKDVSECTYCSLDGSIRDVLDKKNIMFEPISKMSVCETKRVIEKIKPDVIHAHDMRASFFAARACGSIPLVCHIHNNAYDSRKINLKSVLFFYAALKAKHIFWVSETSLSGYCFHSFLRKKSSILLNVINVEKLYEKMNGDKRQYSYDVTFVGRLTYQKNPERLIEVFKKLQNILPNFKSAVIGDGPLRENIETLIREYGLEKNVTMLGFLENPLKILHDSKVMLLVSRWEGLPMCVLESLALGVPVVTVCKDGMESIIKNGKNGFICDSDDDVVYALVQIINDADNHLMMSSKCIEISNQHNNLSEYKRTIESVYNNSIA